MIVLHQYRKLAQGIDSGKLVKLLILTELAGVRYRFLDIGNLSVGDLPSVFDTVGWASGRASSL